MEVFGFVFVALIVSFAIYLRINRAKISGLWGEKKVSAVLSMLGKEYKVFNDVLIKNSYGTSQIDHLVVSPYGIFVIGGRRDSRIGLYGQWDLKDHGDWHH